MFSILCESLLLLLQLQLLTPTTYSMATTTYSMEIVSREEWGAKPPREEPELLGDNMDYVFVHHTAGETSQTDEDIEQRLRDIQDFHMNDRGWNDIGYNFVIGENGKCYEGRGFNIVGAHTLSNNYIGYGVSFLGTFSEVNPSDQAQETFHKLVKKMEEESKIKPEYKLNGHRQKVLTTECPGETLYQTIQGWDHWTED